MKKFILIILALALCVSMAACGTPNETTPNSTGTFTDATEDTNAGTVGQPTINFTLPPEASADDFFTYKENHDGGITITEYIGTATEVIIPEAINGLPVTEIGFAAFIATDITSITTNASMKTIGPNAFDNCQHLSEVNLNAGLMSIKTLAFSDCPAIEQIYIPAEVVELQDFVFGFECDAVIVGYEGTILEAYCQEYGLNFLSLGKSPYAENADK